nr:MAG TPA: putative nucleotidyltransferase [Caudoviricetes sp.]
MINPQEYVNKAYQLGEKVYGNRLIFAAHYGSFNYGLADEESDCDVAIIVMPSMEEIVRCESSNAALKYSPEGNIDVIDARTFIRLLTKADLNSLQYLYAPYHKWNPYWDDIFASLRNSEFLWDITMMNPTELFYNIRGVIGHANKRMEGVSEKKPFSLSDSKMIYNAMRMINFADLLADEIENDGLGVYNGINLFSLEYGIHGKGGLMAMKRGLYSYNVARDHIDRCMSQIDDYHDVFFSDKAQDAAEYSRVGQRLERMIEAAIYKLYFEEKSFPQFWS